MSNGPSHWCELGRIFDARVQAHLSDAYANGQLPDTEEAASEARYDILAMEIDGQLRLGSTDNLLDIGCGTGALLKRLAPRVESARGIDVSLHMVEAARQRGLCVDHYDGHVLPYADGDFTAVLIFFVFINLPLRSMILNLLGEAFRVLRPGGRLFVGFNPHPYSSGFRATPTGKDILDQIRILRRRLLHRYAVHSIPYDIFAEFMAAHKDSEVTFLWAKNAVGKYNVLIRRTYEI